MQDQLFMTKEEQLMEQCKQWGLFSTTMVYEWGGRNFYTRACRTVRQWAEDGVVKRLEPEEMIRRGLRQTGRAAVQWYELA